MGIAHVASGGSLAVLGRTFERLELRDLRLSHTSALYILQGASLKTLLTGVSVRGEAHFGLFAVILAEPLRVYMPPPTLPRVVLVRPLEGPPAIDDKFAASLLVAELGR